MTTLLIIGSYSVIDGDLLYSIVVDSCDTVLVLYLDESSFTMRSISDFTSFLACSMTADLYSRKFCDTYKCSSVQYTTTYYILACTSICSNLKGMRSEVLLGFFFFFNFGNCISHTKLKFSMALTVISNRSFCTSMKGYNYALNLFTIILWHGQFVSFFQVYPQALYFRFGYFPTFS